MNLDCGLHLLPAWKPRLGPHWTQPNFQFINQTCMMSFTPLPFISSTLGHPLWWLSHHHHWFPKLYTNITVTLYQLPKDTVWPKHLVLIYLLLWLFTSHNAPNLQKHFITYLHASNILSFCEILLSVSKSSAIVNDRSISTYMSIGKLLSGVMTTSCPNLSPVCMCKHCNYWRFNCAHRY